MRDSGTAHDHKDAPDVLVLALRPPLPDPDTARRILAERGILISEFAAANGVSAQTMSNWLHGRHSPVGAKRDRYAAAIRLIEVGGVDLATLGVRRDPE